jgi:hypothetical protein
MAILLVYAAGFIIALLVLAVVTFLFLLDDSEKDKLRNRDQHQ